MKGRWARTWVGLAVLSWLAVAGARAAVPGEVDFQGLLLDSVGDPVNGAVTLGFTLFDAPTDGSSVWTETHVGVQVVDGVYDVTLGSQVPITPALLEPGGLYLEIVSAGETLSPRLPLLAVPYAVRAGDADELGGFESAYFTQIIQHFSFDQGDPPNDDPQEGIADVDGDGLANFIDPDNDDDGIADAGELAQGSDINLVTPVVSQVTPPEIGEGPATLAVVGSNFLPGLTASFDGAPAPVSNLTPTSFDVDVVGVLSGLRDLVAINTNGETDSILVGVFSPKRVFVTATSTGGNLGGIAGADALCAARAAELALGAGTYLAWLADSSTNPATRFSQQGRPFERVDGTKIADDWADLTDGSLDNPFEASAHFVWTNVSTSGGTALPNSHCQDWSSDSNGDAGRRGLSNTTVPAWTTQADASCDTPSRLYCFEQ